VPFYQLPEPCIKYRKILYMRMSNIDAFIHICTSTGIMNSSLLKIIADKNISV